MAHRPATAVTLAAVLAVIAAIVSAGILGPANASPAAKQAPAALGAQALAITRAAPAKKPKPSSSPTSNAPSPTSTATSSVPSPGPSPTSTATSPTPTASATPSPAPTATSPLAGAKLWVDPNNPVVQALRAYPDEVSEFTPVWTSPMAQWLGDWNPTSTVAATVRATVQSAGNAVPTFVLYAIPQRDCGSYSAGGLNSSAAYLAWVQQVVDGLAGHRSVVIVEPDGLASMDCLSAADQSTRLSTLRSAVQLLASNPLTLTYLDAGNENWQSAATMASRLRAAGVDQARGFSLNVSNFYTTAGETAFGDSLSALLGGAHFVVDTSRNGRGPAADYAWCNPDGRGLGRHPTTQTGDPHADAYLWIKIPGQSDGSCHAGDPAAGQWFNSYALMLLTNAA